MRHREKGPAGCPGPPPCPCTDEADSRLAVGLLDVERHPRIVECKVDMGAFEYTVAPPGCPGPGLCPCSDEADIRADLNGDGVIDAADDALEATEALYFVVNSDDDNGNGLEDYLDDGPVEGEDDLVEIRMSAKCPALNCATAWWSISWVEPDPPNPALKVWPTPDKSDGSGGVGTPITNGFHYVSWPPPASVWLEALHSYDNIEITLTIPDNTYPSAVAGQAVKQSAVKVAAPCTPARPRYYVLARKSVSNMTGIQANITTRDVAPLCGEPTATTEAMSAVFVGIARPEPSWPSGTAFVQLGYRRFRGNTPGQRGIIRTERYAENLVGPDLQQDYRYWFTSPPPPGTWNYRIIYIQIAQGLNCWEFQWDNGILEPDIPQRTCEPYWNSGGGTGGGWAAEVANLEDRMAGTPGSGNTCVFSACQYQKDYGAGGAQNAGILTLEWTGAGNPGSSQYGGNVLSSTSFEVWDNVP